jgi:hypothetical protein
MLFVNNDLHIGLAAPNEFSKDFFINCLAIWKYMIKRASFKFILRKWGVMYSYVYENQLFDVVGWDGYN